MEYHIKERREKIGMSQADLVKKSGVSRATVYFLENNCDIDVRISTLNALAKTLRCSVSSLFD